MRIFLFVVAYLATVILLPGYAAAQQQLVSDPEIYEKDHFRKQCQKAGFGDDFITRLDINNDGISDAVVNHGAIICDGKTGVDCDAEGCLYNFYVQAKEGGYIMIASARIFGYDFVKRFGNMVFVLKMAARHCERSDDKPCEMTVRVRDVRFVTISRK